MSALVRFLGSLSSYPIPKATLENIALSSGIDTEAQLWPQTLQSKECKKAMAQVYLWLSMAPNVSQGGISFSFTEDERTRLRNQAKALFEEIGDGEDIGVAFGYVGEDL